MSVIIHDEPVSRALGALPWRDIPVLGPDGARLGRFTPGRRSWRSSTPDEVGEATGEEVVAMLRELRGISSSVITDGCVKVGNPALALLLAEADGAGVDLHDAGGNRLGRFVPEPQLGRDQPVVVDGTR